MHSANWRERRDPGVQSQLEPSNKPDSPDAKYQAMNEGRRVLVANLAFKATEKDIRSLFADFLGPHENAIISRHPETHQHLGYGYINFVDSDVAHEAIHIFDGVLFMGRPLNLRTVMKPGKLWITGLDRFNDELNFKHEIKSLFNRFGGIKRISDLMEHKPDPNLGFIGRHCYVDFENGEQADAAIQALDHKEIWNCTIRVREATTKQSSKVSS